MYNSVHVNTLMVSFVCCFIRLPTAEGEDRTLDGSRERERQKDTLLHFTNILPHTLASILSQLKDD